MQVFDSHRLMYRNARLRAFSKANPTIPLEFQENDGTNIGEIVYTNANGYLCRSSDMQIILGLKLPESAIIQVSLDGGTSWPIGWILDDEGSVLHDDDIGTLTYIDENGDPQAWDPLDGDVVLPAYALKSEIVEWHETTIFVDDDTCYVKPDQWTKTIHFGSTATADTINIDLVAARNAQVIAINGESVARRYIIETGSKTWDSKVDYDVEKIPAGYSLLIQMTKHNSDKLFAVAVIPTFSVPTITTMISNAIAAEVPPKWQRLIFTQTDGNYSENQYISPTVPTDINSDLIILQFQSVSSLCEDVTLKIANPSFNGNFHVLVWSSRTFTAAASNLYLQIGTAARVFLGTLPSGEANVTKYLEIVSYKRGLNDYNATIVNNYTVTDQAAV